ncbi:hypothetical protein F4811DRAFT_553545 [Daldinia bambusicola]|nr:hypothetical protein F4811DRAFT_553545 [Daldinia bambusicola]
MAQELMISTYLDITGSRSCKITHLYNRSDHFQDEELEGVLSGNTTHRSDRQLCYQEIHCWLSGPKDPNVSYVALHGAYSLIDLRKKNGRLGFVEIMSRFQYREATNPRDKIFGMLGLIDDIPRDIIDYEKGITDVYSLAILECIRRTGNLDILSHVLPKQQRVSEDEAVQLKYNLPSWVSD